MMRRSDPPARFAGLRDGALLTEPPSTARWIARRAAGLGAFWILCLVVLT
ncbi:hypothetical protein [Roseivivax isoporae]|uniref:Uncharacterized protein n=1 Tax=Roseivivax isoporae LMG 25204 TaxID=1449351 RepID=X7F0Z5_9RHOB|nr:hypothetical protein [Roseivivax isoporae]ETX26542.1 hypothetical protein RISW2_22825 [Roseivivax isoporae LMG 25204]